MIVLGIETSCDDTSVAILKSGNQYPEILSHRRFSQEFLLEKWGGVIPEIAARNHLEKLVPLHEECFKEAQIEPKNIDVIGVTVLPGLLGPLLTGLNTAKTLALFHSKPIYPVNHLHAHLEAIFLSEEISYPYIGLLVSGGHSIFFLVKSSSSFQVLGSTIDDAAGEAFDKGGKIMGLGYPAGRIIDELSRKGDPNKYKFPIGLEGTDEPNLSFSGVKTALKLFLQNHPHILDERRNSPKVYSDELCDICASYQNAIIKALVKKLAVAIRKSDTKKLPIVVGGGVACNSELRKSLSANFANVHFVNPVFCTDNGGMIANLTLRNAPQSVPFPECLNLDAKSRYIDRKDFITR